MEPVNIIASPFAAIAVALVAVNTFGGFLVTQRMLGMFKKKATTSERK